MGSSLSSDINLSKHADSDWSSYAPIEDYDVSKHADSDSSSKPYHIEKHGKFMSIKYDYYSSYRNDENGKRKSKTFVIRF